MSKVAWIGLGVMGFPMAGHLKTRGHDVVVFNRTAPRPKPGSPVRRQARADPRRGGGGRRFRVHLRRQ